MDKQSLTYKTFKNISYSLVGYAWTFVFSIFITPFIVFKLGVETYGVYVVVLSAGNILGLLDLGIGQILIKYIAEYHATGEKEKMKDLMYSFNSILAGIGLIGLLVLLVVGYWARTIFHISPEMAGGSHLVFFLLLGLVSFINAAGTLFMLVPVALQRADVATKLGLANLTLINLSSLGAVMLGYGLKGIFLTQVFFSLVFFFVYRHYAKKVLPESEFCFAWKWSEIKKVYKFGITASMSNIANSALTYFDRLLIPMFNGPTALPYYTLPGSFTSRVPVLVSTISGILFPITSELHGLKDLEKIKNIYKRAINLLIVVSFAATISIVLFANKILLYWLNAEFAARSTQVLTILAFTYFLLSLGTTLNFFLLGLSKTKFLFCSSFTMAAANIILLFILLPKFGILGAAWAYLFSVLPIIYMFYYIEKKFLGLDDRLSYYAKLISKISVATAVFTVFCKLIILPMVTNLTTLIILGPLAVLFYLLVYRLFGFFDAEDIRAINSFILTLLNRFKLAKQE